jgi:hypothetical protein
MKVKNIQYLSEAIIYTNQLSVSHCHKAQLISLLFAYNWFKSHCQIETTYTKIIQDFLYQLDL